MCLGLCLKSKHIFYSAGVAMICVPASPFSTHSRIGIELPFHLLENVPRLMVTALIELSLSLIHI